VAVRAVNAVTGRPEASAHQAAAQAATHEAATHEAAGPGWTQPDLLALAGCALASTLCVLLPLPLLRVAGGLLLPVPVQGAALGLASLPLTARKGLFATAGALGVIATILDTVAIDRLGIAVTRVSVTLTCAAVTASALAVAARRRSRPRLRIPYLAAGPSLAVAGGAVAAVMAAAVVGTRIPMIADNDYSAVAFAGELAGTQGVLTADVGTPVPVTISISNAEGTDVTYTVSVRPDDGPVLRRNQVAVDSGAARQIGLGSVSVADGCLHRFAVSVQSPRQTYLLALFVKGAKASCPRSTG
jgi:hypothetical protein